MPPTRTEEEQKREANPASVEAAWERIRELLDDEKHRISAEIRNYPPPIPACDAQFNHLLEQQSLLSQELHRMREAHQESLSRGDPIQALHDFLESSPHLRAEAKQELVDSVSESFNAQCSRLNA